MRRRTYLATLAGAGTAIVGDCTDRAARLLGGDATVEVPEEAMVDEQLEVSVSGLATDDPVWVEARAVDGSGASWIGRCRFEPDDGRVDLSTDTPLEGTYERADPMGLF
jgi:hypothetical protein